MERQAKIDLLNRVLHETVNSVVQYIDIAVPYVPPGFEEKQERIRGMRDEQARTAQELTALVGEFDGVPQVGVFPYWNVDLNYLDLRFLARFAARHEKKAVDELDRELESLRGDPQLYGTLARVLREKRAHAEALEEIGAPPEPPASEKAEASGKAEASEKAEASGD